MGIPRAVSADCFDAGCYRLQLAGLFQGQINVICRNASRGCEKVPLRLVVDEDDQAGPDPQQSAGYRKERRQRDVGADTGPIPGQLGVW